MSKFKIEISSVPDRENLVSEIWHNEILVAEINQENENCVPRKNSLRQRRHGAW